MILASGCTQKEAKDSSEENTEGYEIVTETYTEKTQTLEINIKYPVIKNMQDENVQDKMNGNIQERIEEYKKMYFEEEEGYEYLQTIDADFEIRVKSGKMLSITFFISMYAEGAAHPNNIIDAVTFDPETGSELELKDLFKPGADYRNVLNPILGEKVKNLEFELFDEYKGIEEGQQFYLTDSSLVIFYQTYVYTPHVVGPLYLEVPFNEIKDILRIGLL
jgi:hypothetical protein